MKVKFKEKSGDYTIVRFIRDAVVDTVATNAAIAANFFTPEMKQQEKDRILRENYEQGNFVYAGYGEEADLVEDNEGEQIQQALSGLEKNQLLLDAGRNVGQKIADYRGVEYNIKKSGEWKKERIEEIGLSLPKGAILQENLTREQQIEMSEQQETKRIAGLSAEQKEEEKETRLRAAAREALNRAQEEELLGKTFDKQAFLQPKKAEIELLYAS